MLKVSRTSDTSTLHPSIITIPVAWEVVGPPVTVVPAQCWCVLTDNFSSWCLTHITCARTPVWYSLTLIRALDTIIVIITLDQPSVVHWWLMCSNYLLFISSCYGIIGLVNVDLQTLSMVLAQLGIKRLKSSAHSLDVGSYPNPMHLRLSGSHNTAQWEWVALFTKLPQPQVAYNSCVAATWI